MWTARSNATINSLVDGYVTSHPDKKRSDEDIALSQRIYTKGYDLIINDEGERDETVVQGGGGNDEVVRRLPYSEWKCNGDTCIGSPECQCGLF
jgi:hypothetical protein